MWEQRRLREVWCKGLDLSNGNRLATQRGQLPLPCSLSLLTPLSGRGGTGAGLNCKRGRGSETGGKWEEQRAWGGRDESGTKPGHGRRVDYCWRVNPRVVFRKSHPGKNLLGTMEGIKKNWRRFWNGITPATIPVSMLTSWTRAVVVHVSKNKCVWAFRVSTCVFRITAATAHRTSPAPHAFRQPPSPTETRPKHLQIECSWDHHFLSEHDRARGKTNQVRPRPDKHSVFCVRTWPEPDVCLHHRHVLWKEIK